MDRDRKKWTERTETDINGQKRVSEMDRNRQKRNETEMEKMDRTDRNTQQVQPSLVKFSRNRIGMQRTETDR